MMKNYLFCVVCIFLINTSMSHAIASSFPKEIQSSVLTALPVLDGKINSAEWSDSTSVSGDIDLYDMPGNKTETHRIHLYLKNNANDLYVAVRLDGEEMDGTMNGFDFHTLIMDSFNFIFDNNNNGVVDAGEDKKLVYTINNQRYVRDAHTLSRQEKASGSEEENEEQNISGSLAHVGTTYSLEIRIPLKSGDIHDIDVNPGEKIRWNLVYFDKFTMKLDKIGMGGIYGYDTENSAQWGYIKLSSNFPRLKIQKNHTPVVRPNIPAHAIHTFGTIINESEIVSSNIDFVGTHYDFVITSFPFKYIIDRLRTLNPKIKILLFNNPYFAFGDKFWNSSKRPEEIEPEWILHDDKGKVIRYNGPQYEGMPANLSDVSVMDIRNQEWQRYYAEQSRKYVISAGMDGVFIDTLSEDIPPFALTKANQLPSNYSAKNWKNGSQRLLSAMIKVFKNTHAKIYYNGISNPPGNSSSSKNMKYLDQTDGTALEAYSIYMSMDKSQATKRWYINKTILQDVKSISERGKDILIEVYGDTDTIENRLFALASFLLVQNKHTYFYFTKKNEAGALKWHDEWAWDIGTPLSSFKTSGPILSRDFTKGVVYVNSGSHMTTIQLKNNYRNDKDNIVNSLMLRPLHGAVLRRVP